MPLEEIWDIREFEWPSEMLGQDGRTYILLTVSHWKGATLGKGMAFGKVVLCC
jgi:hypothetical protein